MAGRIRLPRLTKADVEGLLQAHQHLVALDQTLRQTNWAGAAACIVLAGNVDQLIARLYNKADAAITRWSASQSTQSPQEASAEARADLPIDQGEFAPPGKPEA